MTAFSIPLGNIYIVPVIRQRLNFCVLVQRAVREMRLGPEDLIAVELAPSALGKVQEAIGRFPQKNERKSPQGYGILPERLRLIRWQIPGSAG